MMKSKDEIIKRQIFTPATLQVREAAEGETPSREITGYAILFNTPSAPLWQDEDSEAREIIAPEAITKEILDGMDIKFTMYHNRQMLLARSNKGIGTLSYEVDEKGVKFKFDAPKTPNGEEALELIRRGDIGGCSFIFSTRYYDKDCVERSAKVINGVSMITYTVKAITGIYDFTITDNPAYPDTSVEARGFVGSLKEPEAKPEKPITENVKMREQVREMRHVASVDIF